MAKHRSPNIRRRVSALLLLSLFVTYFVTVAACTHIHFENGTVVVHAHLFHGQHSHNSSQIAYWYNLSNIITPEVPEAPDVNLHYGCQVVILTHSYSADTIAMQTDVISLRAPPAAA